MALPATLRFQSRRHIQGVLRNGRRRITPLGRAVEIPAAPGQGKILFVVSTAVSKRRVERNRIKRGLDEWARRAWRRDVQMVVFVSKDAVSWTRSALCERAAGALTRIGRKDL